MQTLFFSQFPCFTHSLSPALQSKVENSDYREKVLTMQRDRLVHDLRSLREQTEAAAALAPSMASINSLLQQISKLQDELNLSKRQNGQ